MPRLYRNILHNLYGYGAALVFGLVLVRFIFRYLGEDALGIVYFTLASGGLLGAALDMGISTTVTKEVAKHFASDPAYVEDLLRTSAFLYWSLFAIAAIFIWVIAPLVVHRWIHLTVLDPASAIAILRALGISSLLTLPRSLYAAVCRGVQRMELNNLLDVVAMTIQQLGAVAILLLGGGVFHIVWWFASTFAAWTVAYLVIGASLFGVSSVLPRVTAVAVRRNITFTGNMALVSLLGIIHSQADALVVSKLLPIGHYGFYNVASRGAQRTTIATAAVSYAVYPSFSASLHNSRRDEAIRLYHKMQDLICYGTLPLFAGLIFAALPLLTLIFDARIAGLLLLPLLWLCIGNFMNTTLNIPYMFVLADEKPQIAVKQNLLALFMSLPAAVLLIHSYGLSGAGFSWVIYNLFSYAYGVALFCAECKVVSTASWYSHIAKVFALAGLTYGVAWLVISRTGDYTTAHLALGYCAATIVFAVCGYLMVGSELRDSLAVFWRISLRSQVAA